MATGRAKLDYQVAADLMIASARAIVESQCKVKQINCEIGEFQGKKELVPIFVPLTNSGDGQILTEQIGFKGGFQAINKQNLDITISLEEKKRSEGVSEGMEFGDIDGKKAPQREESVFLKTRLRPFAKNSFLAKVLKMSSLDEKQKIARQLLGSGSTLDQGTPGDD